MQTLSLTRRVAVLLLAIFLLPAACRAEKNLSIVASFYPMYIMALNVAGDIPGVEVACLTPTVSGCLHDYSLTPREMKRFETADILVVNGAGMEAFLEQARAVNPRMRVVSLSDGIPLIEEGGAVNPHVWVSVSGAMAETQNLVKGLCREDPGHAAEYSRNGAAYCDRLSRLSVSMRAELAPLCGLSIVTFHEAFPYFAREFGLEICAVIEREPGSAPGARELAQTIMTVREKKARVIFSEPQYPSDAAGTIARETGARVYVLDPAVTGPDQPDAYIKIMEKNRETLKEALKEHA